jgi:hypothetical protein
MLGDKLADATGKVVLRRALSSGWASARMESTQRGTGTLLGVEYQETSTYETELRPDGTVFGMGQGVYMGAGGEMATLDRPGRRHPDERRQCKFSRCDLPLLDFTKVAASERSGECLRI